MRVNSESFSKLREYINNNTETYDIYKYLKDSGYDSDLKRQNTGFMIRCPRHEDWSPSLGYNTTTNVFHCFSCGWSGSKFELIKQLTDPESSRISFIVGLIKRDIYLRNSAGALFVAGGFSGLKNIHPVQRLNIRGYTGSDYIYFFKKMKRLNIDKKLMFLLFAYMQEGYSVEHLEKFYDEFVGNVKEKVTVSDRFDLGELLNE
jgi:hypothetical protein